MDKYYAKSDVKNTTGEQSVLPCTGLTSDALPEARSTISAESSQTGVSTRNVPYGKDSCTHQNSDPAFHWYVLRTTYGREKKAYDYLVSKNVEVFCPTQKTVKTVDGKRVVTEESRIPNIFFAYSTEETLKSFVYDNVNLPYLRFYYRHTHVGSRVVKEPLIVPDSQMNSLRIICAADSDEIIATTESIGKFKEGQRVRITDGKFKGVVGTVARYRSQQRVGIVIEGLLTVCTAYIPSAFIENQREL